MKRFDAVIVGARCAGAATALLLARAGARVLVVDRGHYGTDTLSTHALMRGAVLQLHRWGVLRAIVASGAPPVRSTTFSYVTQEVTVPIEPRGGVSALYAPRRRVLDRALIDAAIASGAEVEYGVRVEDVLRDAQGCIRGLMAASGGSVQRLEADLVVGADGLHSTLAERLQAPVLVSGRHQAATLYSYWQGLDAEGYYWRFVPGASVGVIPTNDALCVFAAVSSERFSREVGDDAAGTYRRWLREVSPALDARLGRARRVEPVRGFGGHMGFIRKSTGPGWALVGDASYFKDPLTAHGITDALRDAELLTRAILHGTTAALEDYEVTRLALSRRLFEITDEIASFSWSDEQVQGLHRAFSAEMSREVRALAALTPLRAELRPAV